MTIIKSLSNLIKTVDFYKWRKAEESKKKPKYVLKGPVSRYSSSYNLITVIYSCEQGITNASDGKPVLATFGVGPCVSVVGYDPNKKVGFLTHYDFFTNVEKSLESLFCNIPQDGYFNFELTILGGTRFSVEMYNSVKSGLKKLPNQQYITLTVSEEDVFGDNYDAHLSTRNTNPRSICLDTRTGDKFVYKPKPSDMFKGWIRLNPLLETRIAKMMYNSFDDPKRNINHV